MWQVYTFCMAQQIELTSKKWKGLKVASLIIMFLISPILYGQHFSAWQFFFFLGVFIYALSRFGAWWNHG